MKRSDSQRRRYTSPPIEEALCEFQFAAGEEWDLTIPGKLHASLEKEYTGKPRQQEAVEASFDVSQGQAKFKRGMVRVQFPNAAGNRMVSVGKDVLSIHMLRPYQDPEDPTQGGWDDFQPRIERALKAYWRVARPSGVRRAAMRYINRIVVPDPNVNVSDYFNLAHGPVHGLPDRIANFLFRAQYAYPDSSKLLLTHATIDAPEGHSAFLLDLDVACEPKVAMTKNTALNRVNSLRVQEREAFEAIVTENARALFDA